MASQLEGFPVDAVAVAAGRTPVAWEAVPTRGYARSSAHWRATFADGQSAFVKHALTPDAVSWLQTERSIYEAIRQPFMPKFLGAFDEGDVTLIVLEDLTDAKWPPPWSRRGIDAVLASLDALRRTTPPQGLERLEAMRAEIVGWPDIAADPGPLLATGLCTRSWLEGALPALLQASSDAPRRAAADLFPAPPASQAAPVAAMSTFLGIVIAAVSVCTFAVVVWLFIWAARKDGEEERAVQKTTRHPPAHAVRTLT